MKYFITAKPNAKEDRVERVDETHLNVWVKASPREGKANRAVMDVVSAYFGIPKSRVVLRCGEKSKKKVVELL
ncbi:MAG: hypothetical protein A3J52_03835 [Omnitrophica bacterium RIFCSPHIGHO2_02_FULL_49_9]|nr:MAG: hypothetical protein A3J52_03835 [Omnitrophica bacterium RIFCSPHIGHO2_02_FULL_49_9]OGW88302.1 MAG: hypothetical protein A3A73_01570 [Omnitrophica bacterium RIFCSPLOWO2_01_FULL_50_24]